jgi:hypothetical protein
VQHRDSVTQDEDLDILAAVLRASSLSQPSSLMLIKYNSRNNTADDHAMIAVGSLNRRSLACDGFWHVTGPANLTPTRYIEPDSGGRGTWHVGERGVIKPPPVNLAEQVRNARHLASTVQSRWGR